MPKINISIDDVSPHPKSSVKVLDRCYELLDVFPEIKFTLFIPMAYTRLKEKSYFVNEYVDFCDVLRNLSFDSFELGWHGYYHGILNQSNNDEFRYLNYKDACVILDKMFFIAKEVGIYSLFSPILRPSAFWMSPASIRACKDKGIKTLALASDNQYRQCYSGVDNSFNKVVYYDSNPPFKPLQLKDNLEVVYHACEWDKNYLSFDMCQQLKDFLNKEFNKVEYVFIEDF